MNIGIIVQARMTSTRLPGKILKPVLGKPLLQYQIERLKKVFGVNKIIVATTTNESDDAIVELCKRLSVEWYRGSEDDVLARYYHAATSFQCDIIIRITSDCPLIDPAIIGEILCFYLDNKFDYVSNCLQRTYPRGMDTEVFSYNVLKEAYENAKEQPEREHVTPFIYRNPSRYHIGDYLDQNNLSRFRLTVDTPEDLDLIKRILELLYPVNPDFKLKDILRAMKANPEWYYINAHIEQKKYGE